LRLGVLFVLLFSSLGLARSIRVMPLGDSITQGGYTINSQYVPGEGGYRSFLLPWLKKKIPGLEAVGSLSDGPKSLSDPRHEGHAGWRIDQIQNNIVDWLAEFKPDVVLLMIGTNDFTQNWDIQNAPARLQKLVDTILNQSPDLQLFLSSITPTKDNSLNAKIKIYNDAIRDIVIMKKQMGRNISWVPIFETAGLAYSTGDLVADGVHPTRQGYKKIAHAWFKQF